MAERADVALVIADLGSGGAQRALIRAAEGLMARGHRVAIVTLAEPKRDFYPVPAGASRLVAGGVGDSANALAGLLRNVARVRALRAALRACGARSVLSLVTQTNILVVLATRGLSCRVVLSERNDPRRQRLPRLWEKLRRLTYPRADAVTINSPDAVSALEDVAGTRAVFLPNPPPPMRQPVDAGRPARWILNVGRLHRQKAQDVLLAAFARIAPTHPDLRLRLVGEGDERAALEAQATALQIADRVAFAGTVTDVDATYREASVFVLPSRHEGTPNALLEAMGHGLPCIVSDASPGLRALIGHEREGLVVPVDDVATLADSIARLADDSDLRVLLGAAAHAKARAQNADAVLDDWEAILGLRAGAV